ncbi:3-isopropylmalate dehydratase small subunit [Tunturiibacter empetritectus]
MHPINVLTSHAVPLDRPNVDTDQIIPKQFLKRIERTGYGDFLFYDWRRIQDGPNSGQPDQTFVLNKNNHKGAKILIAGKNFGCGSSREARRLGPHRLRLPRRHRSQLRRYLLLQRRKERHGPRPPPRVRRGNPDAPFRKNPAHKITINLEAQTITDDEGFSAHFDIDPFRKYCLLNGLDDIGLTLRHESELDTFENKHDAEFWLKPRPATA